MTQLEEIVQAPQCGAKGIRNSWETTARGSICFEHQERLANTCGICSVVEITRHERLNFGVREVVREESLDIRWMEYSKFIGKDSGTVVVRIPFSCKVFYIGGIRGGKAQIPELENVRMRSTRQCHCTCLLVGPTIGVCDTGNNEGAPRLGVFFI